MAPTAATVYTLEIHNLLASYFAALDEKQWDIVRDYLSDEVFTDYSAFSPMPPCLISAREFIEQRRMVLDWLETQHTFQNLRVSVDAIEGTAAARCTYTIRRFQAAPDGGRHFHSHGHYYFDFANSHGEWKIARLKQYLLRVEGARDVHAAVWCA
jgi:hypothetical protein